MASAIAEMFNRIAPHYDGLNHLLSLNIDKCWRRRALRNRLYQPTGRVLDVACGTADFSIALIKAGAEKVEGVDISEEMLAVGRRKVAGQGLADKISLSLADVAALDYADSAFDMVAVSFGVRNFQQRMAGLREMFRVTKQGGKLVVLEFSMPQKQPVKALYHFYFKKVLPWVGGLFSGERKAYDYLPASVVAFPAAADFCNELREAGFRQVTSETYTFGIATVYYANK
ncbi:MAG: bifunctional demethylmenaquinone methyltransferase/2-methoxy-6-polyprenyl-1,4-benzoquinol methylase UbiE [Paludibacteraceae bacterium]|nr:bifunctional demethylmenaquinone methyltransferase/2-methoxy-6-polyprenyl-1,4-benzoquinol methylase UbiE [Paludibacteraceae bacterium]